jgi:dGTPase
MEERAFSLAPPALPACIAVPDEPPGSVGGALSARAHPEPAHPYRSAFVRDVGRILHAKAFRRLAGKTQVFTRRGAESDHSRSRLTHTLEVAQIARIAAATLGLNAPLAEALALVHDIGHPPFGHAGEKALDEALQAHGLGFDHNLHALRIVSSFEERYAGFRGLNLTLAVREGIVKHSRDYNAQEHPELAAYFLDQFPPLEAQLIDLADEIAYLTADFEDGLGAGILHLDDVRAYVPWFAARYSTAEKDFPAAEPHLLANEALKQMLNALNTDLMQHVAAQVRSAGLETLEDVRRFPRRIARLSPEMEERRAQAKRYLYEHLYQSPELEGEHEQADRVVKTLFAAWTANPELLPADHQARIAAEGVARTVADYIAGMTDAYIEQAWSRYNETK